MKFSHALGILAFFLAYNGLGTLLFSFLDSLILYPLSTNLYYPPADVIKGLITVIGFLWVIAGVYIMGKLIFNYATFEKQS